MDPAPLLTPHATNYKAGDEEPSSRNLNPGHYSIKRGGFVPLNADDPEKNLKRSRTPGSITVHARLSATEHGGALDHTHTR